MTNQQEAIQAMKEYGLNKIEVIRIIRLMTRLAVMDAIKLYDSVKD
jgi:hypothetical protein